MLGAYSKIVQDVPPFMLADGRPADVLDINAIGLRRTGLLQEDRNTISDAYKLLYRSSMNRAQAIEQIRSELPQIEALEYLLAFVERVSKGSSGRQDDRPRR
jgi:UDP-N-acetylglucosamine acyltransferase